MLDLSAITDRSSYDWKAGRASVLDGPGLRWSGGGQDDALRAMLPVSGSSTRAGPLHAQRSRGHAVGTGRLAPPLTVQLGGAPFSAVLLGYHPQRSRVDREERGNRDPVGYIMSVIAVPSRVRALMTSHGSMWPCDRRDHCPPPPHIRPCPTRRPGKLTGLHPEVTVRIRASPRRRRDAAESVADQAGEVDWGRGPLAVVGGADCDSVYGSVFV